MASVDSPHKATSNISVSHGHNDDKMQSRNSNSNKANGIVTSNDSAIQIPEEYQRKNVTSDKNHKEAVTGSENNLPVMDQRNVLNDCMSDGFSFYGIELNADKYVKNIGKFAEFIKVRNILAVADVNKNTSYAENTTTNRENLPISNTDTDMKDNVQCDNEIALSVLTDVPINEINVSRLNTKCSTINLQKNVSPLLQSRSMKNTLNTVIQSLKENISEMARDSDFSKLSEAISVEMEDSRIPINTSTAHGRLESTLSNTYGRSDKNEEADTFSNCDVLDLLPSPSAFYNEVLSPDIEGSTILDQEFTLSPRTKNMETITEYPLKGDLKSDSAIGASAFQVEIISKDKSQFSCETHQSLCMKDTDMPLEKNMNISAIKDSSKADTLPSDSKEAANVSFLKSEDVGQQKELTVLLFDDEYDEIINTPNKEDVVAKILTESFLNMSVTENKDSENLNKDQADNCSQDGAHMQEIDYSIRPISSTPKVCRNKFKKSMRSVQKNSLNDAEVVLLTSSGVCAENTPLNMSTGKSKGVNSDSLFVSSSPICKNIKESVKSPVKLIDDTIPILQNIVNEKPKNHSFKKIDENVSCQTSKDMCHRSSHAQNLFTENCAGTDFKEIITNDDEPCSSRNPDMTVNKTEAQQLKVITLTRRSFSEAIDEESSVEFICQIPGKASEFSKPEDDQPVAKPYQKPFISKDQKENDDNNDPKWNFLRKLQTDEERYLEVRKLWKNLIVPDPNLNMTYYSYRWKNSQNLASKGLTERCAPGCMLSKTTKRERENDTETLPSSKRVCGINNLRFNEEAINRTKEQVISNYNDKISNPFITQSILMQIGERFMEYKRQLDFAKEEAEALHKFYRGLPNQTAVSQREIENEQWNIEQVYHMFKRYYRWNGQVFNPVIKRRPNFW